MPDYRLHPTMAEFLKGLELKGKGTTAKGYRFSLSLYTEWLEQEGIDPMKATTKNIQGFQRYLAEEYRTRQGRRLTVGTQVTKLSAVKSYCGWMERRGLILMDASRKVTLPFVPKGTVRKSTLSLQEVTAMIQTQAARCARYKEGSRKWAKEVRDLCLLCLGFATGRRQHGLQDLKVSDVNLERAELRCEWEKGKAGRVLPVATWANAVLRIYLEKARPILDWELENDFLFPGKISDRIGRETMNKILSRVHQETVEANPDLTELPGKHFTSHCLRVSFAGMLFGGGCDIRTINELMMHEQLTTTARYTPIPLEELRRVCRGAHPRA